MTDSTPSQPPALSGSVDDRIRQLAALEATHELSAGWLRAQLDAALAAWAADDTALDIDAERRQDF